MQPSKRFQAPASAITHTHTYRCVFQFVFLDPASCVSLQEADEKSSLCIKSPRGVKAEDALGGGGGETARSISHHLERDWSRKSDRNLWVFCRKPVLRVSVQVLMGRWRRAAASHLVRSKEEHEGAWEKVEKALWSIPVISYISPALNRIYGCFMTSVGVMLKVLVYRNASVI